MEVLRETAYRHQRCGDR